MKRLLTDRVDKFGALGQAAVDLLRAEGAALQGELEGNIRRLLGALLLLAFALFAAFWALGALIFSLIEVVAEWLPRWGAALALVALLALLAWALVLVARRRLARLEGPAATVRRRAEEYQEWWERRVTGGERSAGADPPTPSARDVKRRRDA